MTAWRHRFSVTARSCLLLGLLAAVLGATACSHATSPATTAATGASTTATTTTTTAVGSPQAAALWNACLSWIQQGNTRVTFGDYTVTYGEHAALARLTYAPTSVTGEPLIDGPCWWKDDTDYYRQGQDGRVAHVSVAMAVAMGSQTFPQASVGSYWIGGIRVAGDPYRLLRLATVQGPAEPDANSTWSLTGATTFGEVYGADLPRPENGGAGDMMVGTVVVTLRVRADGTPVSMTASIPGVGGTTRYAWSKVSTPPALPATWVELDEVTLAAAEQEGWRASPQEAAKDIDFPVYFFGDSYQGAALQNINVVPGSDVHFAYWVARTQTGAAATATTAVGSRGWSLFEYSARKFPAGEGLAREYKRLLKTVGQGPDAYSLYTPDALPLGSTILVKRGDTYIFIQATGTGLRTTDPASPELTQELYAAAAALQLVEP